MGLNDRFSKHNIDRIAQNQLALSMGVGNVYRVIKTDEPYYAQFLNDNQFTYSDGSVAVHTTLQSALNATVEGRNDYIIPQSSDSDYDITSVLTMSKKAVHLVCPAGLGPTYGSTNACRIEQITASTSIIAISDSAIEVAGLYLKPVAAGGCTHIDVAAVSYGLNIHNNLFCLKWKVAPNLPAIACVGDGGAWGAVSEWNWFVSMAGNARTCAVIVEVQANATCARVDNNLFTIGDTEIATLCIGNYAVKGNTNYNIFGESGGDGVSDGGTITKAIAIHASGQAIGNIGAMGTGQLLTGGTTLHSYAENYGAYIANVGTTNGSVEA